MPESKVAVAFQRVSKRYLTGERYYPSLRDWVATCFSREFFRGRQSFYALRDLTFAVYEGESVGFIGVNGSGKSTVLKLISKVTKPSSGTISVHGQVTGLLELGAGFHPELTGRENIFFQGTILGMSKHQIAERTDAIIDFAGLEEFIDAPVKHYSSGMYARLGFSIAIHLEPQILLIDEVLVVGDAAFIKKCYTRIEEFCTNATRAVIIVSHNLGMLKRLCKRLYLLDKGHLIAEGEPAEIVRYYLKHFGGQ